MISNIAKIYPHTSFDEFKFTYINMQHSFLIYPYYQFISLTKHKYKSSQPNETFIARGNKNTKVYHDNDCGSLPKEDNRIYFDSAGEAENAGYRAHACI